MFSIWGVSIGSMIICGSLSLIESEQAPPQPDYLQICIYLFTSVYVFNHLRKYAKQHTHTRTTSHNIAQLPYHIMC